MLIYRDHADKTHREALFVAVTTWIYMERKRRRVESGAVVGTTGAFFPSYLREAEANHGTEILACSCQISAKPPGGGQSAS